MCYLFVVCVLLLYNLVKKKLKLFKRTFGKFKKPLYLCTVKAINQ